MGLDARKEILAWLREICPRAFLKGLPFMALWVCIEDILTRLPRLKGPRNSKLFSGVDAYEAIVAPAAQNFNANCTAHIYCCDDQERVPRRKEEEHKKRDTAAAKRPRGKGKGVEPKEAKESPVCYSPRSVVVDDGITDCVAPPQLFDLFALSRNRALRPALMSYLAERAARTMHIPPGRRILLDFDRNGPIELYGRQGALPRIRQLDSHQHPFGEADLSCAYWVVVYCGNFDVVYNSIDSDALPIINNIVHILNPSHRVIWNDGMGVILDMNEVNATFKRMGITPAHFAAICAACGCDWVQGSPLWPRLEGADFTRVRKGMASYGLFGKRDEIMQLALPIHFEDECYWRGMLYLLKVEQRCQHNLAIQSEVVNVGLPTKAADIVVNDYLYGEILTFEHWNESRETEFERVFREMVSRLMGSRFLKVDREAMRTQMHRLAWTVQYWCVPWHRMNMTVPPNG